MKGAVYIDADGKEKSFYIGCYGIGIGRTMATIVEKYNDPKGIIWPESLAPFRIHLIALNGAENETDKLYDEMNKRGVEVLYDDRDKTAGEKFADADLIGLPMRIVVSKKTIQQKGCEFKKRTETETKIIPFSSVLDLLTEDYNCAKFRSTSFCKMGDATHQLSSAKLRTTDAYTKCL